LAQEGILGFKLDGPTCGLDQIGVKSGDGVPHQHLCLDGFLHLQGAASLGFLHHIPQHLIGALQGLVVALKRLLLVDQLAHLSPQLLDAAMLGGEFQGEHQLASQMKVHLAPAPLYQLVVLEQLPGQLDDPGEPLGAGTRGSVGTLTTTLGRCGRGLRTW